VCRKPVGGEEKEPNWGGRQLKQKNEKQKRRKGSIKDKRPWCRKMGGGKRGRSCLPT